MHRSPVSSTRFMSTAVTEPPAAAPTRPPAADFSKPVARPQTSGWQLFKDVLNHGGPGYLQFAITNICNADCGFCGFARSQFDPKKRHSVTLQEAKDVVDIAKRNHIGYLLFVGGEPMAHRDLRAMVRYSAEQGIHPMICTNGGLWNEDNMKALASDGLTSVIMSIDAHDVAKHEANRGLPDVCRKIKRANEFFKTVGIQCTASITASRLIEDYEKLPDFLRTL
ncbi:MAG: radical SAM protein, partial [Pedosphaera sp. Tous-C6FEB]